MKKRLPALMAVVLTIALTAGCGVNSESAATGGNESTVIDTAGAGPVSPGMVSYSDDDYYTDWEDDDINYIELKGNSISLKGSGAIVSGRNITVLAGGTYVIRGELNDGQIIVDVEDKGAVRLVFNGAEISCKNSAPIYVKNAPKTIISLAAGTENSVTDGKSYSSLNKDGEPSGAIFSKDDLSINGDGKLTVNAAYNDGIVCKDVLRITGGVIDVTAADDGLIGRDWVGIKGGTFNIQAGGDGIKSTNDTDLSKGFIALDGGSFTVVAGADGIQAETSMLVTGGTYDITTNGGSENGPAHSEEQMNGPWMGNQRQSGGQDLNNQEASTQSSGTQNSGTQDEKQSEKGLKASSDISVTGGSFKIDSADDAVHTNNSIAIGGGEFIITSGDDGIHADTVITISGGQINIQKSYEGIESSDIIIDGGEINVVASDDGINGGGGSDQSSVNGRSGENSFTSSGNNQLTINDGYIVVNAVGDGIDVNGSIVMTGGTVIVNGPTNDGNGALDYDGTFELSGGYLVAAGSSGMAQAPTESSSQYSIAMTFSSTQKAGTVVSLQDGKGNTVLTFTPEKDYRNVVISSPELKGGAEYTFYSGETKIVTFTPSSTVTWVSETGITAGNQGGMNQGGMGQGGFSQDGLGQGGPNRPGR